MAETGQSLHKVAVAGASGRMGHMLIEAIRGAGDCQLAAALDIPSSPAIGNDAAAFLGHASGVPVSADLRAALAGAHVLIDFTRPEGASANLAACRKHGVRMVIGTTGFSETQKRDIADAGREIGIVLSPNFSVGVNVAFRLLETAASALGGDAPSGTALRMGEVVAGALKRDLKKDAVYGREGVTGERKAETIGFSTVRGGDLVGDHTVMFIGAGERLEISHRASSRANFAAGALRAARWVAHRKSGLYDMADVLGFK
jgi:4-hydroxy-tetrahydrodipicolinate reductase